MRLSGERDSRRGPAAEAVSSKSFAVRFASIVLAAVLTASFMPVAAFAADLPAGNIKVTEYINVKPGEQFELDGWDYASQYEDNEFHSPEIVFGGGNVADISKGPLPGKCKVLAKKPGSTTVIVRFDSTKTGARLWVIYEITVSPHKITPNSKSETYDGTVKSVSGFEALEFEVDGSVYTVEGLTAEARGTNVGEYPVKVSGQAVVIDSDGNNVTSQFTVSLNDAELTIIEADSDGSASNLPHTGDTAALYLMGICAVALTAGAVALFTLRKRNSYK